MSHLTAATLASLEEICTSQNADSTNSYAIQVIREEQIHQYFSQLGIEEGHDELVIGEGSTGRESQNSRDAGGKPTNDGRGPPSSGCATFQDAEQDTPASSLTQSLKIFLPYENSSRGRRCCHQPSETATATLAPDPCTSATPLERFLTEGSCNDPSYIRGPALMHAKFYSSMESAEARQKKARSATEQVQRERLAREGSSSLGYIKP